MEDSRIIDLYWARDEAAVPLGPDRAHYWLEVVRRGDG